jgi:uncharacterized protein YjbJ (UPF0337 family)
VRKNAGPAAGTGFGASRSTDARAEVAISLGVLMNWDQISGNWKDFEGKVQQKWGKHTNDDLQQVKGDHGKIQERYRITSG